MPVRPSTPADLPAIRQLMRSNRSYLDGGLEDLPDLLARGLATWAQMSGGTCGDLWPFGLSRVPLPCPPMSPNG